METFLVYITTQHKQQAAEISRDLLENKLVACANILPGTTSLYRWEGKVEEVEECVLLVKTAQSRLQAVIDRVKALHSYEVSCIAALPIVAGNPEFLQWIARETTA